MPGIEDLFVGVRASRFTLGTGDYPVAGTNCYYLGYSPKDAPDMVESVLDTAQAMALNVIRLWAFLEPADRPPSRDGVPWEPIFNMRKAAPLGRMNRTTGWLAWTVPSG